MSSERKKTDHLLDQGRWSKAFNFNLRTKILISYILLILVPFGFYTGHIFANISKFSIIQMQQTAGQVLAQTKELINYKFTNIIYVSDVLFFDENMNTIIKRNQNLPVGIQLVEDLNKMRKLISNAFNRDNMHRLSLYLDSSVYYANEYSVSYSVKTQFVDINFAKQENWYANLQKFTGKIMWVKTTEVAERQHQVLPLISSIRFIKDIDNYTNIIGILRIDILQSDIDAVVKNAVATDNGVAYIINSNDEIMSASDMDRAQYYNIGFNLLNKIARSSDRWQSATIMKRDIIVDATPIDNTDWVLVSVLPKMDVQSAGWKIIYAMLPLLIAIILVAVLLSVFSSLTLTRRINSLSNKMMAVSNQILPEYMPEEGVDEIGALIRSYNYMIGRIQRYSEMQFKLGQDIKNAEYKALQAQIDPHFLYNTLELINWVAIRNKVPEISTIVQDLARYYKQSLGKGKDTVSIADAVCHIQTYINLQNYRFNNTINLVLDIDEGLYSYSILKLILQPLVENAIYHGILETPSQTGTVTLSVKLYGSTLVLSVSDDGVGMNEEAIARLFGDKGKKEQGYGVSNVNSRIKLFYGSEYGLTCKSVPGQGTVMEIHIPAEPIS